MLLEVIKSIRHLFRRVLLILVIVRDVLEGAAAVARILRSILVTYL